MTHEDESPWRAELPSGEVLEKLRAASDQLESGRASVQQQLAMMAAAGVMRWGIPPEFGGCALSPADQARGHEELASACLNSAFVLSQRNAAVSRLVGSDREELKAALLPRFAAHELMATVGISHLTTSRQHLARPMVRIEKQGDDYLLEGEIPWVTGASLCDLILTGGTFDDGQQALLFIETGQAGVSIAEPPKLLALQPSETTTVRLQNVSMPGEMLVAGPVPQVMKAVSGGTGGVTTSALASGAAEGVLIRFQSEADRRQELSETVQLMEQERAGISRDIRRFIEQPESAKDAGITSETLRARANSLVLRASQAYLAASKGAGFVSGHPAERAVREAMFFLVWSCPRPVVEAAMREFACVDSL